MASGGEAGLRAVATFEAKGVLALLAGSGLLMLYVEPGLRIATPRTGGAGRSHKLLCFRRLLHVGAAR